MARRLLIVAARFVTGRHLDGRRRTDATFWQRGTVAVEPHWWGRGGASWWSLRPGWQRAGVRWAGVAAVWAWLYWRAAAELAGLVVLVPGAGWAVWRAVRAVQLGRHRARVVRPLAAALAPALETSPGEVERTLQVPAGPRLAERDAAIAAGLPAHHQGTAAQTHDVARIVGQRLGGEWQARIVRDPLSVRVTRRPEPPRRVDFADVAGLIRERGSLLRPLMGLGADDDPAWLDFGSDVAHQGVSCGTGGGKSAYLRFLIAQFAYFGCADFPVLDSKGVSLAGMEAVPGLRVYRDAAGQWAELARLRADMEARYVTLLDNPAAEFPLCVVLLEEANDAAIEWRAYWRQLRGAGDPIPGQGGRPAAARDPATPPVYDDITRLMIKGRQVGYRVIGVYQRLSAAACGGIDAGVMRDAYGTKALARFSPQAWDTLTGIRPRAASSVIPGRWVAVMGHDVRAVQVPYGEPGELAAFALSAPAPGVPVQRENVPAAKVSATVPVRQAPAAARLVVGIDAAAEALSMKPESFRKARQRRPIAGEVVEGGRPAWRVEALASWRAGGAS